MLVAGGFPDERSAPTATAEVFTGTAFESAGTMTARRGNHTATRLRDGRVLLVGGVSGRAALATAEMFDGTGFRAVAPLPGPRSRHGAALLADGRVLVVGGQTDPSHGVGLLDTALLYDPDARTRGSRCRGGCRCPRTSWRWRRCRTAGPWSSVDRPPTTPTPGWPRRCSSTRSSGLFTPGGAMAEPRYKISDAVVALPDGRVAVAGGFGVEVYAGGRFRTAAGARWNGSTRRRRRCRTARSW